jgi:hypothetical protein
MEGGFVTVDEVMEVCTDFLNHRRSIDSVTSETDDSRIQITETDGEESSLASEAEEWVGDSGYRSGSTRVIIRKRDKGFVVIVE